MHKLKRERAKNALDRWMEDYERQYGIRRGE